MIYNSNMATKILIPTIKLLVTKGDDRGKVFETNRFPIIIGRDKTSDFVLNNDSNISRKHALIDSDGSKIWLKDLNSTNGSYADNVRITKKTEITDGTIIILGNTWIELISDKIVKKKEKKISPKLDDCATFLARIKNREAIFVLDLFDSSRIADEYGDEVVMNINKIIKKITIPAANQNKAIFIKGTGDGFLIIFKNPENALKTSVDILKKINKHNKSKSNKTACINIRIGLNYGECSIEPNGDRLGHEVNIAFRIEGLRYNDIKKDKKSIAKKDFPQLNRILISENLYKEVEESNYTFEFLGNFTLKGIRGTHKIYEVKV